MNLQSMTNEELIALKSETKQNISVLKNQQHALKILKL